MRRHSSLLGEKIAVPIEDLELIALTNGKMRDEYLPYAGLRAKSHRMTAAVPGIEVADDRYAPSIRCPDGEAYAGHFVDFKRDGAQCSGEIIMRAFRNEMKVELAKQRPETVGIIGELDPVWPVDPQTVRAMVGKDCSKEAGRVNEIGRSKRCTTLAIDHLKSQCSGKKSSEAEAAVTGRVHAEDRKSIAMPSLGESLQRIRLHTEEDVGEVGYHKRVSESRVRMLAKPLSGIGSHFGRFRAS
jgi:hypothetical protein